MRNPRPSELPTAKYWRFKWKCLKRTFSDTWGFFGINLRSVVFAVVSLIGWPVLFVLSGEEQLIQALSGRIALGIVPFTLLAVGLLSVNAALSPFRVWRDAVQNGQQLDNELKAIKAQLNSDDVAIATATLQRHEIDRSSLNLLQLFSALGEGLTLGIPEWTLPDTMIQLLGYMSITRYTLRHGADARDFLGEVGSGLENFLSLFENHETDQLRSIVADMLLIGVIEERPRLGMPDSQGKFLSIEALPGTNYCLTDLGRRVFNRLRDSNN